MCNMHKIEAIVRNSTFYQVQHALAEIGITTYSAYQVQITGIHSEHKGLKNNTSNYIPKSKIEVLCADKDVENIVNKIRISASTGEKGDGIVFSYKIDKLVKIRDGETDSSAL